MPVNKEHLLKIKQHILEEPNRLAMDKWLITYLNPAAYVNDSYSQVTDQKIPSCRTVGCLAGWSASLRGVPFLTSYNESNFLNINSNYFYVEMWPSPYKEQYGESTSPQQKAHVLGEVIDFIIENDGQIPREEYNENDY